jgi:hypothetical protein
MHGLACSLACATLRLVDHLQKCTPSSATNGVTLLMASLCPTGEGQRECTVMERRHTGSPGRRLAAPGAAPAVRHARARLHPQRPHGKDSVCHQLSSSRLPASCGSTLLCCTASFGWLTQAKSIQCYLATTRCHVSPACSHLLACRDLTTSLEHACSTGSFWLSIEGQSCLQKLR